MQAFSCLKRDRGSPGLDLLAQSRFPPRGLAKLKLVGATMNFRFQTGAIRVAITLVLSGGYGRAQSEPIKFEFNPPDGAIYEQTSTRTRILETPSGPRTDVSETKSRETVSKTGDGFAIKSKFIHSTISRNGQPIANPISAAMEGLEVTFTVGKDGQLREIKGFSGIIDAVKSKFPGPVAQMMIPLFNEDSLVQRERAEWEGRYAAFVGKSAEIGDVWVGEDDYPLPTGGTAKFYSATTFDSIVDCGGKKCVLIKFVHDTSSEDLAKLVGEVADGLAQAAGAGSGVVQLTSGVEINGSGERVVDPSTMIIQSERIERTIKLEMDIAGQGPQPATMHEIREYRTTEIGK